MVTWLSTDGTGCFGSMMPQKTSSEYFVNVVFLERQRKTWWLKTAFFFSSTTIFFPLLWATGKNVNYNKNIQQTQRQTQIYNCISVEISKVLKLQVSFMGPMKERHRATMKQRDRRTELLEQRTIPWSCSPIIMILSSLGGLPNIAPTVWQSCGQWTTRWSEVPFEALHTSTSFVSVWA